MSGLRRLGRVVGGAGHRKAALLAGVSLIVLAPPGFSAELSPGVGMPWVLDTAGTYTITAADTSAEDAWIGLDTPGVVLAIDGTLAPASLTTAATKSFHLGINATANGEITTLTGSSAINTAKLISGDQVFVGEGSDNNTMTLSAYSSVTASSVVLGVNAGSDGNLLELLTGTSTIDLTSNLIIGYAGADNEVTLANGAEIDAAGQVILGFNAGASGNTLTVSSGSTVTADVGTLVGNLAGGNALIVESGADFTTYTTTLGSAVGSDGNTFTVTGSGSTYTGTTQAMIGASFNVGNFGSDNGLVIADGAVFEIGDRLALGVKKESTNNTVTVIGAGSKLHAGNIRIGVNDVLSSGNSLIVADSGFVEVTGDIKVRPNQSIDLASGARLAMAGFTTDLGATFVLDVDASNAIDFTVTGLAEVAGTLEANHTEGTLSNRYTVLTSGTLTNTLALDDSGLGPNFSGALVALNNVLYLDIVADLGGTADLGQNQANLADAVNDAFADGAELSDAFVDLFGIADPDLDTALSALTGEINAYAQTELGWSATEAALGMLTSRDLCAPAAADGTCIKAFASGALSALAGDADQGSHDTTQAGFTLGLASATLFGSDTLLSGLVTIDQTRAAIDGLGSADVTGLRLGGSIKQTWQDFYASLGGAGGLGIGEVDRPFSPQTPGSASADLLQAYFGVRGEIGADLALGDATTLTPFAAVDWANTATGAYRESGSGQSADLALAYDGGPQARSTAEIGLRLATSPTDSGLTLGGTVAYRHVLAADDAVETHFAALADSPFEITPATAPADLFTLSADATLQLAPGASLSGQIDVSLADGYQAVAGKIGVFGEW